MSEQHNWDIEEQEEFSEIYGEPLSHVLDMSTWHEGADLAELYEGLQRTVEASVAQERRTRAPMRAQLIQVLDEKPDRMMPECAGLFTLTPGLVQAVHRANLFNGGTECCDGTNLSHDTILLTVVQVGLALVAYQGGHGTWVQRLYRRDLRGQYADPMEEVMALLQRRATRNFETADEDEEHSPLNRLVRRSLMEYAERAALLHFSNAPWRMGHGSPIPLSMLLPATPELLRASVDVLRGLLLEHRNFVYVDSKPGDRMRLTLGNILRPLEYALLYTLEYQFTERRISQLTDPLLAHPYERNLVRDFLREAAPQIVMGIYRATEYAPPRLFYAHRDCAHAAAAIAIADSVLQPHRGFPMLIDLADTLANNHFDSASFYGSVYDAYAAAGEPTRYLGERETRTRGRG